ncbi:MAG: galactokinase 1 [Planctomycetota bacterium]
MPAPRPRAPVQRKSGLDVGAGRVPGWIDLMGDPDGSGDGLVVTLSLEPPSPTGWREADGVSLAAARAVQATLIDGRSGTVRRLPLGRGDVATLVIDSGLRPPQVDRERSARQAECLEAARALGKQSLRDVDDTLWRRWHDELPASLHRRAAHIRGENARAVALAAALEQGDWIMAGRLMTESHHSLLHDYEVSCSEVDMLCAAAAGTAGVLGCRRAGGGFAGQVVALVEARRADAIVAEVARGYHTETGRCPAWCVAAALAESTVES